MADMCVAIETVDGCLSTTDSAAGDGSKTRDESSPRNSWHANWIGYDFGGNRFLFAAAEARASEVFRPYARKYRSEVENAVKFGNSINHRVSNHGRCAAGFPKERISTRVSTTTGHPGVNHGSVRDFQITNGASGVNHGWKRKHPGFPSGVANRDLGPIREFHGSHGSPNGDCGSIQNSRISSD